MQSTYSVYGTDVHLILDDEFAENYNNAQHEFFDAQKVHMEKVGSAWTGTEPLYIKWSEEQRKAFDDFAVLMNHMVELNGGSLNITEESMTSDYLVKL